MKKPPALGLQGRLPKQEGDFKWAVSIKPYPTRDSTRIVKTYV